MLYRENRWISAEITNIQIATKFTILTLFDMGFFGPSVMGGGGGGHEGPLIIAPMIMKLGTYIKLDLFYTMVTKICYVTTTELRNEHYYVIMTS